MPSLVGVPSEQVVSLIIVPALLVVAAFVMIWFAVFGGGRG